MCLFRRFVNSYRVSICTKKIRFKKFLEVSWLQLWTGIVKIFLNFHCWSLSWMLFWCWDYWQTDWLLKEKDGDLWTEVCLYMFKITNRQTELFSFAVLRFCRYYWHQTWDNIVLSIFPFKIKLNHRTE